MTHRLWHANSIVYRPITALIHHLAVRQRVDGVGRGDIQEQLAGPRIRVSEASSQLSAVAVAASLSRTVQIRRDRCSAVRETAAELTLHRLDIAPLQV